MQRQRGASSVQSTVSTPCLGQTDNRQQIRHNGGDRQKSNQASKMGQTVSQQSRQVK